MILDDILAAKRTEVAERQIVTPPATLEKRLAGAPRARDFLAAVHRDANQGIRLIAEFKRASPSQGVIRADLAPADVARMYATAGAAAISVLTDEKFFGGSLADLEAARRAAALPVLRKNFIIDRYQLLEARCAGADAVLLIAAALDEKQLVALHAEAVTLGMAVLVEVHDAEELPRALAAKPRIIGVNNRDLRTFKVDLETTLRLRPLVPPDVVMVSESGIRNRQDVLRLLEARVDAVLVGESLMRRPDPGAAAAALLNG